MSESEESGRRKYTNAELVREGTARGVARMTRIARALQYFNHRLGVVADQLREVQKRDHGAILLQLELCPRGCLGCPHPRWVKWTNKRARNKAAKSTWFAARLKHPKQAAKGASVPEAVRGLIEEGQAIIERRQRLLKHAKEVNRVVSLMAAHDAALKESIGGGLRDADSG